jgi:MFS family permease
MVGVDFSNSYSNAACRRVFPDNSWVGYDCVPTIGDTTTFTVNVPAPPANVPVLNGPIVDPGSFFQQTVFSGLKPFDPAKIAPGLVAAGGATMVLGALVAFPSMLIDSAVEKLHERTSRRRRMSWLNATITGPWAIAFLFGAAIVAGFADPGFGINWTSLRTLITMFLVFMLMNVGSTWVAWRFTRKHSGQEYPDLTAKPFFLLIIAGTVAFARLTNIDPAMVFGSVLALELGHQISKTTEAVVSLIVTAYTFTVGFFAWLGYSWLASIHLFVSGVAGVDSPPASRFEVLFGFTQVTAGEFMSILTIEAFSTIPLALLPIAGMGGEALFQWKKWVWGIVYGVGMLGYIVVILPAPGAWTQANSPVIAWVAVVIVYALVGVSLYGFARWLEARDTNRALLGDARDENTVAAVDAPEAQTPPTLGAR